MFSLGRQAPAPRFPKNEAEYEAARKRYLNTYGKFAAYAVARTARGPLEVLVEGATHLIIAVNDRPLKPEHFGLSVENYVRRTIPPPVEGKNDAAPARPEPDPPS